MHAIIQVNMHVCVLICPCLKSECVCQSGITLRPLKGEVKTIDCLLYTSVLTLLTVPYCTHLD